MEVNMTVKVIGGFIMSILGSIKLLLIKIFNLKSFSYHLDDNISPSVAMNMLRGKLKIGKRCKIKSNVTLSAVNGGVITFGNNCYIGRNCQIVAHESIKIGNNVMIGPNVVILDHDHKIKDGVIRKREFTTAKITIEEDAWIGANCIILKGVTVGKGAVIAAGTVVTHDCPDGNLMVQKKNTELIKLKK